MMELQGEGRSSLSRRYIDSGEVDLPRCCGLFRRVDDNC